MTKDSKAEQAMDQAEQTQEQDEVLEEEIITEEEPPSSEEEAPLDLVAQKEAELAEMKDRYLRLHAEFENFKRRKNEELQTRLKYSSQTLAAGIIPGLDNLERAIEQGKQAGDEKLNQFVQGVEMVLGQLFDALKKENIDRLHPKGQKFDPNLHEALGLLPTEEIEPDHVAEVMQAGYSLFDRVIRPARVMVSKKP